jgi:hypothetical protein
VLTPCFQICHLGVLKTRRDPKKWLCLGFTWSLPQ